MWPSIAAPELAEFREHKGVASSLIIVTGHEEPERDATGLERYRRTGRNSGSPDGRLPIGHNARGLVGRKILKAFMLWLKKEAGQWRIVSEAGRYRRKGQSQRSVIQPYWW